MHSEGASENTPLKYRKTAVNQGFMKHENEADGIESRQFYGGINSQMKSFAFLLGKKRD